MPNWLAMIVAAAITLAASAVQAQEATIIGADVGMSAMDFDAARNSFFNQNDVDGDFQLSFGEMTDAMSHGGSRLFDGYDLDGDGFISYDEYVQTGNELFTSMDADGDGILSSLEM